MLKLDELWAVGLVSARVRYSCEAIGVYTLTDFLQRVDECSNCRNINSTVYFQQLDRLIDNGVVSIVQLRKPCKVRKANEYDDDTRQDACNTLVDSLLASCENQDERTRLAVALLGYDPRENDTNTISDFNL